jgi:hypothetical protein
VIEGNKKEGCKNEVNENKITKNEVIEHIEKRGVSQVSC